MRITIKSLVYKKDSRVSLNTSLISLSTQKSDRKKRRYFKRDLQCLQDSYWNLLLSDVSEVRTEEKRQTVQNTRKDKQ